MDKINLFSIAVSTGTYNEFVNTILETAKSRKSNYICVANVHMLIEAYNDFRFANMVSNAGIITPDGKPLSWAIKLLYGVSQERVAGMDLLPDLLKQAEEIDLPVYFYGGKEQLLQETSQFLNKNYPLLNVVGMHSPPFRKLTESEESEVVNEINGVGAGLVFVVLGCPKQEKWMASMKGRINAAMIGVGGALPVMIGTQKRAPLWMQKAGLEWGYRLLQEPKRLFKRYAITNSTFLLLLIQAFLHRRSIKRAV